MPITLGIVGYVLSWSLVGILLGAVAWSSVPTYKDILAGTLGISIEAIGIGLSRGTAGLLVPLFIGLLLGLLVRFMPTDPKDLSYKTRNKTHSLIPLFYGIYFFVQVVILFSAIAGLYDFITPPGMVQ